MSKKDHATELEIEKEVIREEDTFWGLVIVFNVIAFLVIWVCSGSFLGALALTLVGSFVFGGVPAFVIMLAESLRGFSKPPADH
ncbi:MAG: hypothetical protein LBO00_02585 [Zoogloeaceae bacterium]|nr:hypothetical protein [Zoogloeaceae bacterium]